MNTIHGVVVQHCKKVWNERGFLQEIIRNDDKMYVSIGQTYITQTKNGVTKAWYRHREQTDFIFVIKGKMKLGLYDSRPDAPTFGKTNEIIISEQHPAIVKIPPGIWHGFQAIEEDLLLLHQNSHAFDFDLNDEERLPIGDSSIPFTF